MFTFFTAPLLSKMLFSGVVTDVLGGSALTRAFIEAFQNLARIATKAGVEGRPFSVEAPLMHLNKAEIIRRGTDLGVDYAKTLSCYQPDADGRACGRCDSCRLRRQGFEDAGVPDPTRYQS